MLGQIDVLGGLFAREVNTFAVQRDLLVYFGHVFERVVQTLEIGRGGGGGRAATACRAYIASSKHDVIVVVRVHACGRHGSGGGSGGVRGCGCGCGGDYGRRGLELFGRLGGGLAQFGLVFGELHGADGRLVFAQLFEAAIGGAVHIGAILFATAFGQLKKVLLDGFFGSFPL